MSSCLVSLCLSNAVALPCQYLWDILYHVACLVTRFWWLGDFRHWWTHEEMFKDSKRLHILCSLWKIGEMTGEISITREYNAYITWYNWFNFHWWRSGLKLDPAMPCKMFDQFSASVQDGQCFININKLNNERSSDDDSQNGLAKKAAPKMGVSQLVTLKCGKFRRRLECQVVPSWNMKLVETLCREVPPLRLRARSAPERLPHLAKGLGDATLSALLRKIYRHHVPVKKIGYYYPL